MSTRLTSSQDGNSKEGSDGVAQISEQFTKLKVNTDAVLIAEQRHTISFITTLGQQDKVGYLMKQGRYLSRWKKRFVRLRSNTIEYFDPPKSSNKLPEEGTGKILKLTARGMTSHTSIKYCFCISAEVIDKNDPIGKGETDDTSWFFLADNEEHMLDWMTAINAHIHVEYLRSNGLETLYNTNDVSEPDKYWKIVSKSTDSINKKSSKPSLSFWWIPETDGKSRRPLGIRSVPCVDGPRTGEGVYCGEVLEIEQILTEAEIRDFEMQTIAQTDTKKGDIGQDKRNPLKGNRQKLLRLAGDRGWVFEFHPSVSIIIDSGYIYYYYLSLIFITVREIIAY